MADDLKNRGAQDRLRINVNEDHELAYWTKELECTADELRAAVKVAGDGYVSAATLGTQQGKAGWWSIKKQT